MIEQSRLSNGIRLISDHVPTSETVALSIWVDVGSRYEQADENGIAHFLEHMAFKGTKRRSALQIAEEFDNIGGYLNAYTSREHTVYFAKTLHEDAHHSFDLLGDLLQNSTFKQDELEKERDVVLQEIAMTNDTPDDIVFDEHQAIAFKGQAMGRSILGTSELVSQFNSDHLKQFVKKHYSTESIIISVAGNITHLQAVELAETHFSEVQSNTRDESEPATFTGGKFVEERDLEQVHIVMGRKGISYHDDDIYAIQMLSSILGGGMSSRLFQEIREKRGLVYHVSSFTSGYKDAGVFCVYGSTTADKTAEFLDVTQTELAKTTSNIRQEELDRARTQERASLRMGREGTGYRCEEMGRRLTCFGRYISSDEILQKLDEVTIEHVQRIMQNILSDDTQTIAAIGPSNAIKHIA